jgi:hypothetical protein
MGSHFGYAQGMEIPKDKIIELIRERVGGEKAAEADAKLPDKVDPEQHKDLLSSLGIDVSDLLKGSPLGGIAGKLGL